ncbi:hypothetical protein EOM09_04620 [bacterium]|nr:hypothetical protein [bacterium]
MNYNQILLADIGGTNINFAIYDKFHKKILFKEKLKSHQFKSFEDALNSFLKDLNPPIVALLAVSGPIINNKKIEPTNDSYSIEISSIKKKCKINQVYILNDFTALSYSILNIKKKDLIVLNSGKKNISDKISLLGAGTDLGKSLIIENKDEIRIIPSEGAHCDFPIQNEFEFKLCEYIKNSENIKKLRWGHLVSGRGIERIYDYLQKTKYSKYLEKLSAEEISKTKKTNLVSEKTFEIFYKFYARAIRNSFFENLSLKGIYLAGGIIQKNLDFNKNEFLNAFNDYGL